MSRGKLDYEKIIDQQIGGSGSTLYYKHQNSSIVIKLATQCMKLEKEKAELLGKLVQKKEEAANG